MSEATKRPWKSGTTGDSDLWIEGTDPTQNVIADIVARGDSGITDEDEANAELIVRAVNSFEALLEAAKDIVPRYDITADGECKFCGRNYGRDIPKNYLCVSEDCPMTALRAAIRLAEGEEGF